jgi:hypothetical protein
MDFRRLAWVGKNIKVIKLNSLFLFQLKLVNHDFDAFASR